MIKKYTKNTATDTVAMSNPERTQLIIITGLSGAGKSTALRHFEDQGYFCIDNLPTPLIPKIAELCMLGQGSLAKVVLVIDIREGDLLQSFATDIQVLSSCNITFKILYLEASEEALLQRYRESRRRHPLSGNRTLLENIRLEAEKLAPVRALSSHILNTSCFSIIDLRENLTSLFKDSARAEELIVKLISFGYKYGLPLETDLVFDVRFLPNPFYDPKLRPYNGQDKQITDYLLSFPVTSDFLEHIGSLLNFLLPQYIAEKKSYLTIAIGCTGGKHRSVAMTEMIQNILSEQRLSINTIKIEHRDISKE